MQEGEIDIIENNEKGWLGKIKDWSYENWQTILVILVVLIVGISAYNYNQQNNDANNDSSSPVAISENNNSEASENSEVAVENNDQKAASDTDSASVAVNEEANKNTNKKEDSNNSNVSVSGVSGKTYTISAIRGEGITHLARHALEKYVTETGDGSDLNSEQKIYIEDYMQKKTGSQKIEIGHQEIFSEGLIKESIAKAKNLSTKQIENLKKYIKS